MQLKHLLAVAIALVFLCGAVVSSEVDVDVDAEVDGERSLDSIVAELEDWMTGEGRPSASSSRGAPSRPAAKPAAKPAPKHAPKPAAKPAPKSAKEAAKAIAAKPVGPKAYQTKVPAAKAVGRDSKGRKVLAVAAVTKVSAKDKGPSVGDFGAVAVDSIAAVNPNTLQLERLGVESVVCSKQSLILKVKGGKNSNINKAWVNGKTMLIGGPAYGCISKKTGLPKGITVKVLSSTWMNENELLVTKQSAKMKDYLGDVSLELSSSQQKDKKLNPKVEAKAKAVAAKLHKLAPGVKAAVHAAKKLPKFMQRLHHHVNSFERHDEALDREIDTLERQLEHDLLVYHHHHHMEHGYDAPSFLEVHTDLAARAEVIAEMLTNARADIPIDFMSADYDYSIAGAVAEENKAFVETSAYAMARDAGWLERCEALIEPKKPVTPKPTKTIDIVQPATESLKLKQVNSALVLQWAKNAFAPDARVSVTLFRDDKKVLTPVWTWSGKNREGASKTGLGVVYKPEVKKALKKITKDTRFEFHFEVVDGGAVTKSKSKPFKVDESDLKNFNGIKIQGIAADQFYCAGTTALVVAKGEKAENIDILGCTLYRKDNKPVKTHAPIINGGCELKFAEESGDYYLRVSYKDPSVKTAKGKEKRGSVDTPIFHIKPKGSNGFNADPKSKPKPLDVFTGKVKAPKKPQGVFVELDQERLTTEIENRVRDFLIAEGAARKPGDKVTVKAADIKEAEGQKGDEEGKWDLSTIKPMEDTEVKAELKVKVNCGVPADVAALAKTATNYNGGAKTCKASNKFGMDKFSMKKLTAEVSVKGELNLALYFTLQIEGALEFRKEITIAEIPLAALTFNAGPASASLGLTLSLKFYFEFSVTGKLVYSVGATYKIPYTGGLSVSAGKDGVKPSFKLGDNTVTDNINYLSAEMQVKAGFGLKPAIELGLKASDALEATLGFGGDVGLLMTIDAQKQTATAAGALKGLSADKKTEFSKKYIEKTGGALMTVFGADTCGKDHYVNMGLDFVVKDWAIEAEFAFDFWIATWTAKKAWPIDAIKYTKPIVGACLFPVGASFVEVDNVRVAKHTALPAPSRSHRFRGHARRAELAPADEE